MDHETMISPLAILTHEAVKAFLKARNMDTARELVKLYFRMLANYGGEAVARELSGQELDAVHQAASITHRPVQSHGSAVTA